LIAWLLGIVHHTAMKSIRNTSYYVEQATEETVPDDQPLPEEQAQGQLPTTMPQKLPGLCSSIR
jgi:hypothetical protein